MWKVIQVAITTLFIFAYAVDCAGDSPPMKLEPGMRFILSAHGFHEEMIVTSIHDSQINGLSRSPCDALSRLQANNPAVLEDEVVFTPFVARVADDTTYIASPRWDIETGQTMNPLSETLTKDNSTSVAGNLLKPGTMLQKPEVLELNSGHQIKRGRSRGAFARAFFHLGFVESVEINELQSKLSQMQRTAHEQYVEADGILQSVSSLFGQVDQDGVFRVNCYCRSSTSLSKTIDRLKSLRFPIRVYIDEKCTVNDLIGISQVPHLESVSIHLEQNLPCCEALSCFSETKSLRNLTVSRARAVIMNVIHYTSLRASDFPMLSEYDCQIAAEAQTNTKEWFDWHCDPLIRYADDIKASGRKIGALPNDR